MPDGALLLGFAAGLSAVLLASATAFYENGIHLTATDMRAITLAHPIYQDIRTCLYRNYRPFLMFTVRNGCV